jgi:myo-inositol catabolism protein IolC
MSLGYDKPLYILPFDHRGSFQKKMFGWEGTLSAEQTAEIAAAKRVIYDGFLHALEQGVPQAKAGILVDEQFGEAVIRDAVSKGIATAVPAEKSGQNEFDFEYGEDFGKHIEAMNPTFCKVLVRFNPDDEAELNRRQTQRLARLSKWLAEHQRKFVFELLVPATKAQLDKVGGDKKAYEAQLRPALMIQAIHQIQDAGVEPDVWKIEGVDRRDDCVKIAEASRRGGRGQVGNIVLGRGENEAKVYEWLRAAAGVPGYIGFAVGRTTFWDAIQGWREKKHSREDAVAQIATNYQKWVKVFEEAAA